MLRTTLCLAAAVLTGGLRADDKPPAAKPTPLLPGTAKVQGDNLLCELMLLQYVAQKRTETVVKDGKTVTVERTVYVPVYRMERRLIPMKGLRAHVIGDKGADPTKRLQPLDPTKLPEMLKNSRGIYFAMGDKVSAEQTKGLKDGSLILVPPREKPAPPEKK